MECQHDVKINNRGDLNNHTTSAYECGSCGAIGTRKWGSKGLGPMKWQATLQKTPELGHASLVRMSQNLERQDAMQNSLTSERRFERLMGVL